MKRILLLVTVAVMLAFSASPAFGEASEPAPCLAEANTRQIRGLWGQILVSSLRTVASSGRVKYSWPNLMLRDAFDQIQAVLQVSHSRSESR
jgi:hypothetical protein